MLLELACTILARMSNLVALIAVLWNFLELVLRILRVYDFLSFRYWLFFSWNSTKMHHRLLSSEWFAFIGQKAGLNVPGSPYGITFLPLPSLSSGMRSMNVSTYSCGDDSLGCSCGDCPSAPSCSNKAPPPTHKKHSCSINIGSLEVNVDFSVCVYQCNRYEFLHNTVLVGQSCRQNVLISY